jgi:7-carboxy-7-deazaguanine synthase
MYEINEIFNSIDGEGIRAGENVTFIRTAGCNLRCSYCDTEYALKSNQGKQMSVYEIMNAVKKWNTHAVTLTGGEPLSNKEIYVLIDWLIWNGYEVNIETNGAIDIGKAVQRDCIVTMDWKTPYSGMEKFMLSSNLKKLREKDVLKLVCAESDLDYVKNFLLKNKVKAAIFLSPVFGKIEPRRLVELVQSLSEQMDVSKIRVQLQIHKYIWEPNKRGV